jgi:hypothetical protein
MVAGVGEPTCRIFCRDCRQRSSYRLYQRLAGLAEAELGAESAEEAAAFARRRRGLQKQSLRVSWLNLVVSVAVTAFAVNA